MHASICTGRLMRSDRWTRFASFRFVSSSALINLVKTQRVTVARQNDTMCLKIYFTRGHPVQKFVRYATNDISGWARLSFRAPSRRCRASGRYYERREGQSRIATPSAHSKCTPRVAGLIRYTLKER